MKTTLEPEDIQAIGDYLVERVKPLLSNTAKREDAGMIFDVPALCEYLNVTSKWIHERTHLKEIPYIKLSNKQLRFKKRDIDKWLDSLKTPALSEYRGQLKSIHKIAHNG